MSEPISPAVSMCNNNYYNSKNFCNSLIPWDPGSKVHQNRIVSRNKKREQARVVIREVGPLRIWGGNAILKTYVFEKNSR